MTTASFDHVSGQHSVNLKRDLRHLRKWIAPITMFIFLLGPCAIHGLAQQRRQKLVSSPATRSVMLRQRIRRLAERRRFANLASRAPASEKVALVETPSPTPSSSPSILEHPEWRLNWFLFQRTFPNDTLPSQGRFFAFTPVFQTQPGPQPTPTPESARWVPIGPTPIVARYQSMGYTSGRVNCIAVSPVDPQTILVGGATGGIWRSIDGGNNFDPVSDDHVDLAVGSLAFSLSNPDIVYAGMGDVAGGYMGTGVLKSVDGGRSWQRISGPTLPAPGLIANILVEPSNPDRVYLTQYSYRMSTGEGEVFASGFFLSSDGGRTWQKTFTGLPTDLVHHPTNPNTLFLAVISKFSAVAPSAGVYRSVDGGQTWQILFAPPYREAHDIKLGATVAKPELLYVLTGGDISGVPTVSLMRTQDSGSTWEDLRLRDIDVGQFVYNSHVAVDPTQPNTVYIGTRDLYKSNNSGQDWINLTGNWHRFGNEYGFNPEAATAHSDQHALVFAPSSPNVIYIGNDGGVSRSSDGGETFGSLNGRLSLTQFNSVTVHPTDATMSCGGTQDNGALVRRPGALEWREFVAGDSGNCLMNPVDPSIWYTSYVHGTIYRYRNDGNQFEAQITSPATFGEDFEKPRIAFYPPLVLDTRTGGLFLGTWRLFSSSDQGNSWSELSDNVDLTHGRSEKFGFDVVSALAVDPRNSNIIVTGSAQGRIMITTNGGAKWRDVTRGLPRRFITSIRIDPQSGAIYVTVSGFGSGHVFRSNDAGLHWSNLSATLPNIPVNTLLIDPVNANTLYVGTDVGVFRSLDNGQNWSLFNFGMPPVIVTGFSAQQSGLIQAATYGRGVYQLIR